MKEHWPRSEAVALDKNSAKNIFSQHFFIADYQTIKPL